MKRLLALTAALFASTALVAKTPLAQDTRVKDSLLAAAVGDEIRKNCPSISARLFVVLAETNNLKRYALANGHSEAEIKAFLNSETEKRRMTGLRDQYLRQNGVVAGDATSYCVLGNAEIARKTLTGRLLKSN